MKSKVQNSKSLASRDLTKPDKILLHVCCGICSLEVIERLKQNFPNIILFFYNPNIYPLEEYERRLDVVRKIALLQKLELIEGPYEKKNWFSAIKGLENEPEGGRRCEVCFKIRLGKTAQKAKEIGCNFMSTTLTMGPRKKAQTINKIGEAMAQKYGLQFLAEDFKKKDGFKKTMATAKKHNFYRQNYCGCLFSFFPFSRYN
jgi:predicted adenine nucleotide alpha hydrolase (AANH) superfamily ATPase